MGLVFLAQVGVFLVNEKKGAIGGGGEGDKVVCVALFDGRVMDKRHWERKGSSSNWG